MKLKEQILDYINDLYKNATQIDDNDYVVIENNNEYLTIYKQASNYEEIRGKDLLRIYGLNPEQINDIILLDKQEIEQLTKLIKINKLKKQVEQLENEINIK